MILDTRYFEMLLSLLECRDGRRTGESAGCWQERRGGSDECEEEADDASHLGYLHTNQEHSELVQTGE